MATISLKLPEEQTQYLKKMSHYLSIERNQDLTFSDLIREALNNTFPMPKEEKVSNGKQKN